MPTAALALFAFWKERKMDLEYVMSIYPTVHPDYLLVTMIDIRDNGYPRNYNIINWFERRLLIYVLDYNVFRSMSEKLKAEKRSNLYKNIDFDGWRAKHSNMVRNSKNNSGQIVVKKMPVCAESIKKQPNPR